MYVWLDEAKVSSSVCHRVVQLILAYSWARPAVLAIGKGRGGMMLFNSVPSLSVISLFLPYPSLSCSLLSLVSLLLPFSGRRHKMTHKA